MVNRSREVYTVSGARGKPAENIRFSQHSCNHQRLYQFYESVSNCHICVMKDSLLNPNRYQTERELSEDSTNYIKRERKLKGKNNKSTAEREQNGQQH